MQGKQQDSQKQGRESPLPGNNELLHQFSSSYEVTAVINRNWTTKNYAKNN